MSTESISPIVKQRRANANFILVGVWAAVAGVLATGAIAWRQRDWKVFIIPLFFFAAWGLSADLAETKEMKAVFETLKFTSSGVAAAALVKQNKEEAQQS